MTKHNNLRPGVYVLWWKRGGDHPCSVAAVGILNDGSRWFAPSNWTSEVEDGIASVRWDLIEKVERINALTGVGGVPDSGDGPLKIPLRKASAPSKIGGWTDDPCPQCMTDPCRCD